MRRHRRSPTRSQRIVAAVPGVAGATRSCTSCARGGKRPAGITRRTTPTPSARAGSTIAFSAAACGVANRDRDRRSRARIRPRSRAESPRGGSFFGRARLDRPSQRRRHDPQYNSRAVSDRQTSADALALDELQRLSDSRACLWSCRQRATAASPCGWCSNRRRKAAIASRLMPPHHLHSYGVAPGFISGRTRRGLRAP